MFIFWKGNGILLPLFALLGSIAGVGVNVALGGVDGDRSLRPMAIGIIVGTWLYILCCDKRPGGASLYFLPMKFWAVLITGLAAFWYVQDPKMDRRAPRGDRLANAARGDGERAFRSAEKWLGDLGGKAIAGNSTEAEQLAGEFAATLATFRSMTIEGSTSGDFRCYCFLGEETCAFLVRVPRLRKFSDEAKTMIHSGAWRSAVNVCKAADLSPRRIGVGVRGIALYSGVMIGSPRPRMPNITKNEDSLISFFKSKPKSDPNVVAEGDDQSPQDDPDKPRRQLPSVMRTWIAADGRPMEASLREFTKESPPKAVFERTDGKSFTIDLDRFSPESQEEIKSYMEERKDAFGRNQ